MPQDNYPKLYLYKRIVQAKLFIDAHYAERIDLNNISDEAHFSKFHFIRLFRQTYGRTPHQYLTAVRIEKARQQLRLGHSVADTCYGVGFESLSAFGKLFRKVTGISPSAFARNHQTMKQEIALAPLRFVPACFAQAHGWAEKIAISG